MTLDQAIEFTRKIVPILQSLALVLTDDDIVEDFWYGISPEWDLNLWKHQDGSQRATIYPVDRHGNTDTWASYPVPLEKTP